MTVEAELPGRRPSLALDGARLLLLAVLGALVATWGAFLVPAGPRVGGHVLSVGAALGVVGAPVAARLGLRAVPRSGGVATMVGWVVVALGLSLHRDNGSVVLPGSGDLAVPALVYVVGGLVCGAVAASVRTSRTATDGGRP